MKKFFGRLFLKIMGWNINENVPEELFKKCVVIAAPHTSNWDYPLTIAAMAALDVQIKYTIKKQWMQPPLGWFFRMMGGIGVNRAPKKEGEERLKLVDAIANLFENQTQLTVIVQAEGTRSLRTQWKTGFYYIALKAKVPIALGYLDYKKKECGIGKVIYPTGKLEEDMRVIMAFYEHIPAKHPEKYALDERFYRPGSK